MAFNILTLLKVLKPIMEILGSPNRYQEAKKNLFVKSLEIIIYVLNHSITFMFVER